MNLARALLLRTFAIFRKRYRLQADGKGWRIQVSTWHDLYLWWRVWGVYDFEEYARHKLRALRTRELERHFAAPPSLWKTVDPPPRHPPSGAHDGPGEVVEPQTQLPIWASKSAPKWAGWRGSAPNEDDYPGIEERSKIKPDPPSKKPTYSPPKPFNASKREPPQE